MSGASLLCLCVLWVGCGESITDQPSSIDTGPRTVDGSVFDPDTSRPVPDVSITTPDADFTARDADLMRPDLQVAIPDATVGTNDMGSQTRVWTTRDVFEALQQECGACHGNGQSSPFFESFSAFVDGIVANERYVTIGQPENSALLPLLDGTGTTLAFAQMPPGGATYSERTANDDATPSMQELAAWIASLTEIPDTEPPIVCAEFPSNKLIHRLNRLEYNRSVQLLLGTSATPADDFPSEDLNYGFDNIAQALTVSPLLIEKYDLAAASLAAEALPDPRMAYKEFVFEAESEMQATTGGASGVGWNLWSRGNLSAFVTLNAPGRYRIRANVRGGQAGPETVQFAFLLNEAQVVTREVTTNSYEVIEYAELDLPAGEHSIGVRFLNDYYCPRSRFDEGTCGNGDESMIGDRNLYVDWVSLDGPLDRSTGTSAFEANFLEGCDLSEGPASYGCARQALNRFARFAWRRPMTEDERARLWESLVIPELAEDDGLRSGLRQALHAILLSPNFIFRVERSGAAGTALSAYERATRLSMFLWRQAPTEALLDRAEAGDLDTPDGVAMVAAEMLQDADTMIQDLAEQWLLLKQAALVDPEYALFPDFDEALRESMLQETRLVFAELWATNRSLLDIVNADFTYVNGRLAAHYGIEDIEGDLFQRIELPQAYRKGVLTHASWLAATSERTRTSPVKRGKWVLEELLCIAPPAPPPGVEGLPEGVDQNASLRERLEQHRADPACSACHIHMDAVGFGLEQFNAVGAFRTHDGDELIEPAGELEGGIPFADAVDMTDAIRTHPNLAPCVTDKILIYALGRGLSEEEFCHVDPVVNAAALHDHSTTALIDAIVRSPLFLNRGEISVDEDDFQDSSEGGAP